jgi:hypothetical protein
MPCFFRLAQAAQAIKSPTAMTSMNSMKAMTAKMKPKSKIAKGKRAKASVWLGRKEKTSGGLKKSDLVKSKTGKIVSKKQHEAGKKAYERIAGWTRSVQKAREQLGIQGFEAIKRNSPLYIRAKKIYDWPVFTEILVDDEGRLVTKTGC